MFNVCDAHRLCVSGFTVGRDASVERDQYGPDHELLRASVRKFIEREVAPHQHRWEQERDIDRAAWVAAGKRSG
jgi:alkylation response protein AidB-like acyl-CoA dehydrogenase